MGRGRDKDLIRLRDEALCRRYYELTEKQRLRFDDALKVLSRHEFFLSEERILAIVRRMAGQVKGLALKPVPKVRMPRLTHRQLELFSPTPAPSPDGSGEPAGEPAVTVGSTG